MPFMNPGNSGFLTRRLPVGFLRSRDRRRNRCHTALLATLWVLIPILPVMSQTPPKSETLAEVNGVRITSEAVDAGIGKQVSRLEEQIYQLRQQRLEALIREKLLAQEALKRGISVQSLIETEVSSKVPPVTDQEVDGFYQANKPRLQGEEAALRDQIRSYLQSQKLAARQEAFLKPLREQAKVAVYLKRPPVFRAAVPVEGAPFRGAENAPVTIVEVSDYHCPYCKSVQATLKEVLARYAGKVKLVFRDFPLEQLHPDAPKAAEAARCAGEQGKFWEYHDRLMEGGADASPATLKAYSQELGLDVAKFEQCTASGKYQPAIRKDLEEGARLGVTGTPAFFINGRLLSGALPLESFVKMIEEELAGPR